MHEIKIAIDSLCCAERCCHAVTFDPDIRTPHIVGVELETLAGEVGASSVAWDGVLCDCGGGGWGGLPLTSVTNRRSNRC